MAGKPIATVGSMHVCPMVTGLVPHVGGPVTGPGAPNVLINGKPAALMGDMCVCAGGPDTVAQGEPTVLINGTPVATMGSMTAHGGTITVGDATVMIGSATPNVKATMPLNKIPFPEIRIIDRVGAMMRGRSSDLRQAEANQNQIREEAEVEEEPMIYNVRWVKDEKTTTSGRIKKTIKVAANVRGIDDGESILFSIERTNPKTEELEQIQIDATVQDGKAIGEWEIKEKEA